LVLGLFAQTKMMVRHWPDHHLAPVVRQHVEEGGR
jgi:hypothetical protein